MNITIWQYIETFCRDHNLISLTKIVAIPLIGYFANKKAKNNILKMKRIFIAWVAVIFRYLFFHYKSYID